jgi:hypothetical protein
MPVKFKAGPFILYGMCGGLSTAQKPLVFGLGKNLWFLGLGELPPIKRAL